MRLDVIFAADALRPPLTGIGRYTYELAKRLGCHERIDRLRYFSSGRWVDDPMAALETTAPLKLSVTKTKAALRDRVAGSRLAVRLYKRITPALFGWRLRGNDGCVYHSPNYIVPNFSGRTVSTIHDLSHILYPNFHPQARVEYMNMALGESLARTDHVITVSETVRQEVLAHGLMSPEQVTAIHLAAGNDFRPHTSEMLDSVLNALGLKSGRYSLFVGTIEPRKNIQRLVEAYGMLPKEVRHNWPLVIAGGNGWNSSAIHLCLAKAQAQGWLQYISYVDQSWLPALYAGARLMAYPSLYEGFGLPIVEAMASGTPVLTSNVSCMPEIAGGAARLVNPLNLEEISYGLQTCLTDEHWQRQARTLGLVRSGQMSWDQCSERTIEIYAKVAQLVR